MDVGTAVLVGIALLNAFTAIMTFLGKREASKTRVAVQETRADMKVLEVNTNHKMDLLMEAKVGEAFGKGVAQERSDAKLEAQASPPASDIPSAAHEGLETAAEGLKDAAAAVKKGDT